MAGKYQHVVHLQDGWTATVQAISARLPCTTLKSRRSTLYAKSYSRPDSLFIDPTAESGTRTAMATTRFLPRGERP